MKWRSKYRNVWTTYNGIKYASKREAAYAAQLDLLVRAGEIKAWRRQIQIPLRVSGRLITTYVADFEVRNPDGNIEYHEVKGYWTPEAKLKWKLFDALYPQTPKIIVK